MTQDVLQQIGDIPNQLGYLVLNEDGAVLESDGDLINDEPTAKVLFKMVRIAWNVKFNKGDKHVNMLSLVFPNHILHATVSNEKVYIVKKPYVAKV